MFLGKGHPHPEDTHPRVKLADHRTGAVALPPVVDYYSKVASWPMYYNDSISDCTCAGVGHMIQAWTANSGTEVILDPPIILKLYETLSGYNPATGQNDTGLVEQDVLQYLVDTGVGGHKILAFAQVDHTNLTEMAEALQIFGGLYLGIQCPKSMQDQFAQGQVIDYVPGSPIEGGHCITLVGADPNYLYIVTWGKLVKMTWGFWSQYGDESWAIVTQDFIEANGMSPDGLNLQTMLTDFHSITGAPVPSPRHSKPVQPNLIQRILNWLRRLI